MLQVEFSCKLRAHVGKHFLLFSHFHSSIFFLIAKQNLHSRKTNLCHISKKNKPVIRQCISGQIQQACSGSERQGSKGKWLRNVLLQSLRKVAFYLQRSAAVRLAYEFRRSCRCNYEVVSRQCKSFMPITHLTPIIYFTVSLHRKKFSTKQCKGLRERTAKTISTKQCQRVLS